jgi:hypothetical protein
MDNLRVLTPFIIEKSVGDGPCGMGRPPWVGKDQGGEEAVVRGDERLAFGSPY